MGKDKLLASAPTLKGIVKLCRQFYCGADIELGQINDTLWKVYIKTKTTNTYVERKKSRYYLYLPND